MGRAFPEAQMTSFAIHDRPMFPFTLADIRDNEVVIARAASWKWMERLSRKVTTEVGSLAFPCKAPTHVASQLRFRIAPEPTCETSPSRDSSAQPHTDFSGVYLGPTRRTFLIFFATPQPGQELRPVTTIGFF